jgi:hypothetical protein
MPSKAPRPAIYVYARSRPLLEAKVLRCLERARGEGPVEKYVENLLCRDPRMEHDRLLRDARGGRVRIVYVDRVVELGRSTRHWLNVIGKKLCYHGCDVVEVSGPTDTTRPGAREEILRLSRSADEGYNDVRLKAWESARLNGRVGGRRRAIVVGARELVARYLDGAKIVALSELFGVTRQTIRTTLERYGVYRKPGTIEEGAELDVGAEDEEVRK